MNDVLAFFATSAVCLTWLEACSYLRQLNIVGQALSRKLLHIGCGLLYLLLWPLYSNGVAAPYICASVPLFAAVRYALVGFGLMTDIRLVSSTSRGGRREELLKGPVAYGVVHGLAACGFWRESAVGVVSIAVLCAGDGLAEVVGSRWGRGNRWPHNPEKSVAGSLACAAGGLAASLAYTQYFLWHGYDAWPAQASLPKLTLVSLLAAAVESLPIQDLDNLTVPASAALASALCIRPASPSSA